MAKQLPRRQILRTTGVAAGFALAGPANAAEGDHDNERAVQDLWIRNNTKREQDVHVTVDRQASGRDDDVKDARTTTATPTPYGGSGDERSR